MSLQTILNNRQTIKLKLWLANKYFQDPNDMEIMEMNRDGRGKSKQESIKSLQEAKAIVWVDVSVKMTRSMRLDVWIKAVV